MKTINTDYAKLKLISGEYLLVKTDSVVGYCHCSEHRGYITKKYLKTHDCVRKGCHYFEKRDNPYWTNIEQKKAAEQRKKENARRLKDEEEAKRLRWIDTAQKTADAMRYGLIVTNVKKIPRKKRYVLFYVSYYPKDDWYRFIDLARCFGEELGGRVELRHAKNADGSYATIPEIKGRGSGQS